LSPPRPGALHLADEAVGHRLLRRARREPLEILDHGLPWLGLLEQLELVTMLVALEELVAGRPESGPHRLRLRLAHRTDGLPFGLQGLDLRGRRLPVGGVDERLGLLTERFLPREVGRPLFLPPLQVLLPAGEEPVAGGAEALPHGL